VSAETDLLIWLWHEVVLPSWLSLVSAPLVLTGYILIGRMRRAGWWFTIASQAGLLAIGAVDKQYGLAVVLVLIWQAFQNWRRWGRPNPIVGRLTVELTEARARISELEAER
jgi:hypothetical protein